MRRLFLASEAKHPESIEKLREFVGGFEGKKITYIPTAANGEEWGCWKEGGSYALAQTLGAAVKLVELEQVAYGGIEKAVGKPDIVWMAGGMCGYLLYWIRRRRLDVYLETLLDSGTVYVGSSAGSMVCAPTIHTAEIYHDEAEYGATLMPGLGYIDFEIYPHYESSLDEHLKNHWTYGKLCLLKNGDAIAVEGDTVRFFGEEKWFVEERA